MIAILLGDVVVVDTKADKIILQVGRNVGYEINIITPLTEELSDLTIPQKELELYIYTVYKENDVSLYGFETLEERRIFGKLLTVKGVGPSIAMTILSEMTYDELAKALVAEDTEKFMAIKGIGETTAQNIVSKLG